MYRQFQPPLFTPATSTAWPYVLHAAGLLLVVVLSACGQSQLSEQEYLQLGRDAFLNGDLKTSEIHLKNVLLANQKNAEARYLLGRIYLEAGNGDAALLELERAKDLGFSSASLIVPTARAYLLADRFDELLDLPIDDESLAVADRAQLHSLRGYAYIYKKQADGAQDAFAKALALQPDLLDALLGEVRLALAQADIETAAAKIEAAAVKHPQDPEVLVHLGEVAFLKGDLQAAKAAYADALTRQPENLSALAKRALVLIALGDMEGAKEDIAALERLAPARPSTLYAVGLYHYTRKDFEKAQEALDGLISLEPDNDRALFLLGATNIALGNEEQGLTLLERFQLRNPGSVEGTNQLVRAYLRRGDNQRAEQTVDAALLFQKSDPRLLALKALTALAQNRLDVAIDSIEQAERANPDVPGLELSLGLALLQGGDAEGAIEVLSKAAASGVNAEVAENARVLAYLKSGDFTQALSVAKELAAQSPQSALRQNLLAYVFYTAGEFDEAKAAYEAVLMQVPGDPTASHNLAVMALDRGAPEDARALYEEALNHNPTSVPTLVRLGLLEESLGETASSMAHLRKALELNAASVEARVALARHHIASGSMAEAAALLEAAPANIQSHPAILTEVAKVQAADGEVRDSVSTLQTLVARYPAFGAAWLQLGLLQEQLEEREAAATAFTQAMLQHRPNELLSGTKIARGLYRVGREDEARELFDRLWTENPEDLNVLILKGWLEQQAGQHDAAAGTYRTVFEKRPGSATALVVAGAYSKSGQPDKGIELLRGWLERHPDDLGVGVGLAQLQLDAGRQDDAAATLSELIVRHPQNAGLHNDVALLLNEQNPTKALQFARRANELAPEVPAIMDTLGVLLLDAGQVEESVELLSRAAELMPDNPAIRLHLARALVAGDQSSRGRAELEQLLARYPSAPEHEEAQKLLNQLSTE